LWREGSSEPDDGSFGIDDIEVKHRVNLHRDVVTGDHVLARYLDDLDAQIHAHHFLDEGNQQHKAGPFDLLKAPQSKDHGALIFAQDPHARANQNEATIVSDHEVFITMPRRLDFNYRLRKGREANRTWHNRTGRQAEVDVIDL
jgi:hypothetical protein